jgi:MFS family permease
LMRAHPAFTRTISSQFIYRFGISFAAPLLPLYYVLTLNASDESIGIINTVGGIVLIGAYFLWARLSRRRGIRFALLAATLPFAIYPIILSFTQHVPLVILLTGIAGIFSAGIDLVLFDMVISSYPQEHGAMFSGVQQTTVYVAGFIAPLVATALATSISISFALLMAGVIRLVGFAMFVLFAKEAAA